jgi:hypothetical protein
MYSKEKSKFKAEKDRVYIVAGQNIKNAKPTDGKRTKLVDKRMKKEKRADKRVNKRKKKEGSKTRARK